MSTCPLTFGHVHLPSSPAALFSAREIRSVPDDTSDDAAPTQIYVCVTCRSDADTGELRAGARLHEAIVARVTGDPTLRVIAVECLSVCKRPCTVSFAAPGKWTYVYGDLPAEGAAEIVAAGAHLYGATPDGLIPWKLRPDALKKGVVARIPPLPAPSLKA